jgi:hypothetical protein
MWKKFAIAILLAVIGSNAATAQTVEWRNGTAVITAATAACQANGTNVGDTYNARYRHPNLGDNPNQARLTLIGRRSAHVFGKDGGFNNTFQTVDFAGFIGSGLVTHNSPPPAGPYQPQIRMTGQKPATNNITETTPQIFMTFKVRGFFVGPGVPNCNIDLNVSVLQ